MGVEYRALHDVGHFERAVDLEIAAWGLDPRDAVPSNLFHALVTNGALLVGAFDADQLVGVSFAFPVRRDKKWLLWSHMTGVHPDYQGQGVGFGLKQFQRAWAIQHGYDRIAWTFDPLQRGNANFNFSILGVTASTYHINFYGEMTDSINAGLPSDRVEVLWKLRDARVKTLMQAERRPAETPVREEQIVLRMDAGLSPALANLSGMMYSTCYAQIPDDLAALKHSAPQIALRWRLALREVMTTLFQQGYAAVDFITQDGSFWYVFQKAALWYLYVVECSDHSLYTGITTDIQRRLKAHNAGRGAAYTAARRPVKLRAAWSFSDRSAALKAEESFKRHSRQAKWRFIDARAAYVGGLFMEIELS